jgi:predicted dehydrogenase
VLVRTVVSVISPGTERAVTELAGSSLLAKAKARPDLVRQVIKKARTEGLKSTTKAVRNRLEEDIPLGYSAAGIVEAVGEYVSGISPGDRVATAGAGKANHAEFQAVPGLLCAKIPEGVSFEQASFATISAIALHAFRLAEVGPGARVAVVGLGLVGQLAVRIALASGCEVAAIDLTDFPVDSAKLAGAFALKEEGDATTEAIMEWSRSLGVDAVILATSGKGSDAIGRTPALCRDRATIVVVGDVALELTRRDFYEKELTLRFARSYGPGRYERSYEDWGVDYPAGHVRWTEGRNLEAVLDLIAGGRLEVDDLITHRFSISRAERAYDLITNRSESYLGVQLTYDEEPGPDQPIELAELPNAGAPVVGLIGAGTFASNVLVPALKSAGFDRFAAITSASGLTAKKLAEKEGFARVVSGADAVISDPDVEVVVIATPHDTHAALTVAALKAGKHVFCEKPLALSQEELDEVEATWRDSGKVLFVGFNRRWSPAVAAVRDHFAGKRPVTLAYRVDAGPIPEGHWYEDRRQGGRLIGEVCHFIDTCAAIVGTTPESTSATGDPESTSDPLVVSLNFPDRSLATITYSPAPPSSSGKERIEVTADGSSALVEDFKKVSVDGRAVITGTQNKGHDEIAVAFLSAINGRGDSDWQEDQLATSRSVLLAAGSASRDPN